jgi:hypothetical protein
MHARIQYSLCCTQDNTRRSVPMSGTCALATRKYTIFAIVLQLQCVASCDSSLWVSMLLRGVSNCSSSKWILFSAHNNWKVGCYPTYDSPYHSFITVTCGDSHHLQSLYLWGSGVSIIWSLGLLQMLHKSKYYPSGVSIMVTCFGDCRHLL